jgi:aspartate ammonia-lyase
MWLLVVRSLNLSKLLLWQEENKILDKMHRQKVAEVEKLSTTVAELEEAVLAGGAAVNAARDYQRQVEELLVSILNLQWSQLRALVICCLHSAGSKSGLLHSE